MSTSQVKEVSSSSMTNYFLGGGDASMSSMFLQTNQPRPGPRQHHDNNKQHKRHHPTDNNNREQNKQQSHKDSSEPDNIKNESKPENLLGKAPTFQRKPVTAEVEGLKFGSGKETNEHRIETRMKQIQFGKNTIGYDNYCAAIPKEKRSRAAIHPRTPDPTQDISKRAFDGYIKAWRRSLHMWDNGEVRPDLNPELVKVQVKRPGGEVKFEEEKALGQKRKISSEEPADSDTEAGDSSYANKLRKQQLELELGTERDEYADAEKREQQQLEGVVQDSEEMLEDGYISEDVL